MSPRPARPLSIEHALLGLLHEQPLHGYELYRRVLAAEALGAVWPLKRPHFYALLTRLHQAGYLTMTPTPQAGAPTRVLLHLTDAGRAGFAAWLHSPVTDNATMERDLLARLYFARRSGPDALAALCERQRAASQHTHDTLQCQLAALPNPHSFAALVLQWRLRQVETVLAWLDTSLAAPPAPAHISYPIAPLRDSAALGCAMQFVHYVCSPAGQRILQQHGFLAAYASPLPAPPAAPAGPRTLTIYAAASLTAAFRMLGAQFAIAHPGTRLSFQFAGSHQLAQQLAQGAPADVFASAHRVPLERVVAAGRIAADHVHICAHNRLAVATARRNPARLLTLADLAVPGRRLVVGSDATAVGHYALDMLDQSEQTGSLGSRGRLGVLRNVVGYADTPRAVLDQLLAGRAEVAIVFASDCASLAEQVIAPLLYPTALPWSTS